MSKHSVSAGYGSKKSKLVLSGWVFLAAENAIVVLRLPQDPVSLQKVRVFQVFKITSRNCGILLKRYYRI